MVEDTWFSSYKTVKELKENWLKSILTMKIEHSGYPKKQLLEVCIKYGQVGNLMTTVKLGWEGEGEEVPFYAMFHCDKKPMLIIKTYGMVFPGSSKTRHQYLWEKGTIVHHKWLLK